MAITKFRVQDVERGATARIEQIDKKRARFREKNIVQRYASQRRMHRWFGRLYSRTPPSKKSATIKHDKIIKEEWFPMERCYAWGSYNIAEKLLHSARKARATGVQYMDLTEEDIEALLLPLAPKLRIVSKKKNRTQESSLDEARTK